MREFQDADAVGVFALDHVQNFMRFAVFIKRGRIVPFAEVLAGAAHLRWSTDPATPDITDTDTKFALQPGGGVTVLLTENVSVRAAVDYRRIVFTEDDEFEEDNSQVRAIAGVVFGWGAR